MAFCMGMALGVLLRTRSQQPIQPAAEAACETPKPDSDTTSSQPERVVRPRRRIKVYAGPEIVWIAQNAGTKYHVDPKCTGLNNATCVTPKTFCATCCK